MFLDRLEYLPTLVSIGLIACEPVGEKEGFDSLWSENVPRVV